MSLFSLGLRQLRNSSYIGFQKVISLRTISQTSIWFQDAEPAEAENVRKNSFTNNTKSNLNSLNLHDPSDRSRQIPVELSIKYLQSDAYKKTYGTDPVWKMYRRNFKGQFIPQKTRKTCIRNNVLATGNPCPICRDEYLVLDYRNVLLLNQFISSLNGEIISYKKTGICQKQYKNLLVAVFKARDYGTITFDPPFIKYNYKDWCDPDSYELDEDIEEKNNL